MLQRFTNLFANIIIATVSVLATLGVLEVFVFGLVLKPDDVLPNVTINGVVRYLPNTEATFRHPDGRESRVSINADGWNSPKASYSVDRVPGRLRIAVIGDSYVHAGFVNPEEGYPEVIERALQQRGVDAEVFRFGMDGAPLSQYLHVLRREVLRYQPDVVVVGLIHNDFDESYRVLKSRTGSSFMKIAIEAGQEPIETPPVEFRPGLADALRNFAAFRYLYYETNLHIAAKSVVSRAFWGGDDDVALEHISSAVDVRRIGDHDRNRSLTRYVFGEMKELSAREGFGLLLMMDGVREAIYAGTDANAYEVGTLNRIAGDTAMALQLPFIDLQETFSADWKQRRERFEFSYDWHWNVRGNQLVGEAVTGLLVETFLNGTRNEFARAPARLSGFASRRPTGG